MVEKKEIGIPEMLAKLDEMHKRQDIIIVESKKLYAEYNQLNEDIEMLEMMIMHRSNRNAREVK